MNMRDIRFTCLTVAMLYSSTLSADQSHYNNMLIGDRAAGLGGAYTAISDDASGLFYNPAGVVFAEVDKLSASVNAYHTTSIKYRGVLSGGNWKRQSSALVPNFFGIIQKFGSGFVGFSYAVTDSIVENQDSVFNDIDAASRFIVNINNRDTTTLIGPSFAMALTDTLNLGVTLYFHKRERELINNQWLRKTDGRYEWSNLYYETSETGYSPIIGLLWTPSEEWSLGLSYRKTTIRDSSSHFQSSCVSDIANNVADQCATVSGSPLDPDISSDREKRSLPDNVRLGFAYFPSERFLFDIDLSYHNATQDAYAKRERTLNLALGTEYYFNQNWALRLGVYSDRSNTSTLIEGEVNQPDHIDLNGFSLSLTRFSKDSSLSIGFSQSSGRGEAQVIAASSEIQTIDQLSRTVYLSSSYRF